MQYSGNTQTQATKTSSKDEFYFQWHFLENCNLRCKHCYQTDYRLPELSSEQLLSIALIIDKTLEKWGKIGRISLTGGEPFIRKDLLLDLIDFFDKSTNCGRIGILTNGTLIDEAIINSLKAFDKLGEIQVSIDGASSASHDEIRGKGSFDKAIDGINILKNNGFFVSLMFTLHKLNKDEVIGVIDLADQLGVDAITLERMTPMNANDLQNFYLEPNELFDIYNRIYGKKTELEQNSHLKIRLSRPVWTLISEQIGGFCPAGLTSLCILHDGTVLPCRRLNIPLGNILADGLFKIWYTSDVLWKLRNKNLLAIKCKECQSLSNCGGCRAIAYQVHGDFMAEDPQCWKNEL